MQPKHAFKVDICIISKLSFFNVTWEYIYLYSSFDSFIGKF